MTVSNADEILAALDEAVDATDDPEAVIRAMSRAFAVILRVDAQDQITKAERARIMAPFWLAEAMTREVLPDWYWADRGKHGFVSAYSMVLAWSEPPGSRKRDQDCPPGMRLIARIVANDLDSLVAAYELQHTSPDFPPASVLMAAKPVQPTLIH